MALELISVAFTFFNAYRYLDGSSTKAFIAIEALGIVSAAITLVAVVFGFLAIYYVKPDLVSMLLWCCGA